MNKYLQLLICIRVSRLNVVQIIRLMTWIYNIRLVNIQLSQHLICKNSTLNLLTLTEHYKFTGYLAFSPKAIYSCFSYFLTKSYNIFVWIGWRLMSWRLLLEVNSKIRAVYLIKNDILVYNFLRSPFWIENYCPSIEVEI